MFRLAFSALAAVALLSGCSGANRTVEKPVEEVRAMVQSAEAPIGMTRYLLPGAGYWTEPKSDGHVWHFTLNGQDYARMTVTLDPVDGQSTRVVTRFEEVADASGPGVPFLQDTAKSLTDEILEAALAGRPLDTAALERRYKVQAATNPMAAAGAARAYMDEAARTMNEMKSDSSGYSSVGSVQPYDKPQPYDSTPKYDRN